MTNDEGFHFPLQPLHGKQKAARLFLETFALMAPDGSPIKNVGDDEG